MNPLSLGCKNAPVGHCMLDVWLDLKKLVSSAELSLVFAVAVSNHNLRGVLVGHHNSGLW